MSSRSKEDKKICEKCGASVENNQGSCHVCGHDKFSSGSCNNGEVCEKGENCCNFRK